MLLLSLTTASYVFTFILAILWLDRLDDLTETLIIYLIAAFLATGLFLGRFGFEKARIFLQHVTTVLMVIGVAVLVLLTL
jgi:hypothetical protein